jgi:chromosome segregation ATPase
VALYDFIISYTKPGYIAEEQKIDLAPFREELADELSEACAMLTFLMYENGLGIKPMLKENYEEEERRREHEKMVRRAEKIEMLRRKIKNSEESPEEYIFEIEKQLRSLENENAQIAVLKKEIDGLKAERALLDLQISEFNEEIARKEAEKAELEAKHSEEIEEVREEMNKRMHDNLEKYENESRELEKEFNERLESSNIEMMELREQCRLDVAAAREERRVMEFKYDDLYMAHEKLSEEKTLCEARLKGVRAQYGLMTEEDDFTERDTFGELEKEYEAFERFYNSQWDQTKKKIRKSILNFDNLTGRKRRK